VIMMYLCVASGDLCYEVIAFLVAAKDRHPIGECVELARVGVIG
jgi:hypothetical protein